MAVTTDNSGPGIRYVPPRPVHGQAASPDLRPSRSIISFPRSEGALRLSARSPSHPPELRVSGIKKSILCACVPRVYG
jgi:hypothetical protein